MKIFLIIALAFGLSVAGSEKEIDVPTIWVRRVRPYRDLLPSSCDMGLEFCKLTCKAIGHRSGECVYGKVSR